jgi:hypothetical protein
MNQHLEKAKEYLAIAESGDSKREAYRRAAGEIAAAIGEGASKSAVATANGKSRGFVRALVDWHESGYKAETPWLADDQATTRAARSHARSVIRDPEQRRELVEALEDEERDELRQAIWDKDLKEASKDPNLEKAHKRHRRQSMEDMSHVVIRRAFDNIAARIHYYADFPLNEMDKQHLQWLQQMVESLLRGVEMDDDLKEILDEAAKK